MSQKQKITITRGIVELKTLDKRIQKAIDSGTFVSRCGQFTNPNPEAKNAQAQYQSVRDLLERRKRLKASIVASNALTEVTICGEKMTVAEAIETKSSIKHLESLLNRLKFQYAEENRQVEAENSRVRRDLENKTRMNNGEKNDPNFDLTKFSREYMEMHGIKLYDPLKAKTKIDELEEYITKFRGEVDFVLSEKNSTTFIEV